MHGLSMKHVFYKNHCGIELVTESAVYDSVQSGLHCPHIAHGSATALLHVDIQDMCRH